jgi:glycosidase
MPPRTPSIGSRSSFGLGFPARDVARAAWNTDEVAALAAKRGRPFALRELARRAAAAPLTGKEGLWRPGELIALTLIGEVQRALIAHYCDEERAGAMTEALDWLEEGRPGAPVIHALTAFGASFPEAAPLAREPGVAELISVRMLAENPAATPYQALFDDTPLTTRPQYPALVTSLEDYFETLPVVDALGLSLFGVLRAASKAHPDSLHAQLSFIRERFARLLPSWLVAELVVAGDVLSEEEAARGGGPGPIEPLVFGGGRDEYENFTQDRDWMANVVLLAKSTYVWLDQLSRTYGVPVTRLDQIPDAELDRLARFGFTGLWLIGVWERSTASRTIKQWRGNPEALASAYSLHDYAVAHDLGGDDAWWDLHRRCRERGVRLATDMVPNHTGLDSRWIVEHPDYFLQLDSPPYPGYRFTGADLSPDPAVSVHLEDGYWDHSDAAVVFKLYDHRDGRERYIYHGNDGTSMPWNDTAQIDYLNAAAREEVIQKILHVARMSSIIRFDAAMTLARQHVQRLWYPLPGHGGAIPSRAEHALTQADFDRAMPVEFWREVVDRVQAEVPDTLLLAEAFWLMEGYFVRTLGMHRVYNSAFMHMLRDEDNANYRQTLKNVLDFSAEVLKRFVNFMNNPDEETAVEQFGKGDKYFGVALMLVTLPGLPMIGHGQVEGFSEKYGMEYKKAYRDERVDEELVARHRREVFPLMRMRHVFSDANEFALYDFQTGDGHVNEDVFAYSNRAGEERALICYQNAFRETAGWVKYAVPTRRGGSEAPLVNLTLLEALGIDAGAGLVGFREQRSGLWYLRYSGELAHRGLFVTLHAYQSLVFLDWRVVPTGGAWTALHDQLGGAGVPDLDRAVRNLELATERDAFRRLASDDPAAPADVVTVLTLARPAAPPDADATEDPAAALGAALAALARTTLPPGTRALARALTVLRALPIAAADDADLFALAAELDAHPDAAPLIRAVAGAGEDLGPVVSAVEAALGVHSHDGVRWFRGELMESLVRVWALHRTLADAWDAAESAALDALVTAAAYRYDALLEALGEGGDAIDAAPTGDDGDTPAT